MSMQILTLEGRLGKDAEIKTTAKGNTYVTFPFAVDYRDKDGNKATNWYNVTSFQENHYGKFAEYLKKGSGLIVIGTPTYGVWMDRNGQAKVDLNVRASILEFPTLGGNRDEQKSGQEPVTRTVQTTSSPQQEQTKTYTPVDTTSEPEDELPF